MTVLIILLSDLFRYCTQDELKEELDAIQKDEYLINSIDSPQANDVSELFTANADYSLDAKLAECTGKVIRRRPVPVFGCLGNCIRLPFRNVRRAFQGKCSKNTKGRWRSSGRGCACSSKNETSLRGGSASKINGAPQSEVETDQPNPASRRLGGTPPGSSSKRPARPRSAGNNQPHIRGKRMSGMQAKGVCNNEQLNPRLLNKKLREAVLGVEQPSTSNGGLSWTLADLDQDRNLMFSRDSLHKERLRCSRGRNTPTFEV